MHKNRRVFSFNKPIMEYSNYFNNDIHIRNFYILVEYIKTDHSYDKIGKAHWISRERIRQIIEEIEKMINRIDNNN